MACSCDHSKVTLKKEVSTSGHSHAQVAQAKENSSKKVIDPVCKMALDSSKAVGKETYKQRTYFFCSKPCLEKFKAEPKKFIQS
ncbi:MAG: YHS domain-containing protein [Armatimonadetes bacterium]|nr:YHS domain-containing protein [Armatimonadota bacterium]